MDDQLPDVVPSGRRAPGDLMRLDRPDRAAQVGAVPGAAIVGLVEQREETGARLLAHRGATTGSAFGATIAAAFGAPGPIAITCFMPRMKLVIAIAPPKADPKVASR